MHARALVRLAQMKIGIGIVRLFVSRLLEQCDGLVKLPIHDVKNAEIKIGEILFGIGGHLDLELLHRVGNSGGAVLT